ncbi:hypothetical protein CASFOL_024091 [Castilleja foliolosa]|uniref:Nitrate transporter n=1 Tax=Castilleja foliolosa TaxID=1961234 RepID=A0ABD3CNE7_9LAMI
MEKENKPKSPPSESPEKGNVETKSAVAQKQRKPGGWKSMPFILGNETFERLASTGLGANFMMFLLNVFNMDQVLASNVLNVYSGISNFSPLIGAFISDAYLGRFKTIAYATFASLAGMLTMTLISWIPQLHPKPCTSVQPHQCAGPNKTQFGVLALALGLLSVGTGGIRPCSLPFGVDQFDSSTQKGRRDINSFFNWYYTSFTVVLIISLTLVVYIQDKVSWVWGFGIPTTLMLCATVLYFVGMRYYVYVKPEGSALTGVVQVIVASYKKRKAKLPVDVENVDVASLFYNPPLMRGTIVNKLPLTNQLGFFNKAALIMDGEILPDGSNSNFWRLCSVQSVEEMKCLVKVIPIWISGIICFLAIVQQSTFTVSQALTMDRHLGPNFQVPVGSLLIISMITIGMWLPFYDRILVPYLRKTTRIEGGITPLQRMGVGIFFSIMAMIIAGLVERLRKASVLSHAAPITIFWLAPQLMLLGFTEAFNIIGQIEFYNKEFPENMSSLANSLFTCTMAGASYLSVIMVNVVHRITGLHGRHGWVTNDINEGKIENLYFLIAGLGVLNLVYFIWVSRMYRYKTNFRIDDDQDFGLDDIERRAVKK